MRLNDIYLLVFTTSLQYKNLTRWSSKKRAVSGLSTNTYFKRFLTIIMIWYQAGAIDFQNQIIFKFLCLLHTWNDILLNIYRINCSLETKDTCEKIKQK